MTSGWRGTLAASVRATASSSTTARVVIAGSATGYSFGGPDSGHNVVSDAKDKTDDDLDGFSSSGVGDKEQNP